MTRAEIISRIKRDRPGESTDAELNLWLDQLDMRWTDEVLKTHWGWPYGDRIPEISAIMNAEEPEWKCEDGKASAGGITVRKKGNVLYVSGTSTGIVNIRLNGESLGAYVGFNPPAIWTSSMQGPGSSGYKVCYVISGGNEGEVALGFKPSDTQLSIEYNELGEAGMIDTTGDGQASNACLFLQIPEGVTMPEDWAIWMKIPDEDPDWPDEWAETVRAAIKDKTLMACLTREVLIPEIDEEVYIHWLYSKIDYRLGEMERYNNDAQMFNYAWDAAAKRWHRHHMPIGRQVIHNVYGHGYPWYPADDPLNQRGW